jgi:hypothetical protein
MQFAPSLPTIPEDAIWIPTDEDDLVCRERHKIEFLHLWPMSK